MSTTQTDYKVVEGVTPSDLTTKVALQVDDGWKVVGSPVQYGDNEHLCQAMIKETEDNTLEWVDVHVKAVDLAAAGKVIVKAGSGVDQYKVRDIRLVGGGTNFAAGGNRLLDLTDGTTVYTTIANADLESAPAATLTWGNTKVPFLTGTSDTETTEGDDLYFNYSGGTTDHATGDIIFSVQIEKVG